MSGPSGFTTEEFVDKVTWLLHGYLQDGEEPPKLLEPGEQNRRNYDVDEIAVNEMFSKYDENDVNNDGFIDFEEFRGMATKMNLAPKKKNA